MSRTRVLPPRCPGKISPNKIFSMSCAARRIVPTLLAIIFYGLASSQSLAAANGLRGDYFNSLGFTNLVATQTNATVDFNWGAAPPIGGLGANYSVRWSGQVVPLYSETYTVQVTAATGARLWVNDKLLCARTVAMNGGDAISGTIALVAGQSYNLVLEYICNTNNSRVQLAWSSASQPLQVIPQSQLYTLPLATSDAGSIHEEYWLNLAGTNFATLTTFSNYPSKPSGRELLTTFESLAPNWTTNLGTRVSGWLLPLTNGIYQFAVAAADTAQLWLSTDSTTNNRVLIASVPSATGFRQFGTFPAQTSGTVLLTNGQKYFIELIQKASTNSTYFSVAWQPPGATGLSVIPGDFLAPNGLHIAQPNANNLFNTLATARPRLMASPERFAWLRQCIASNSPAYVITAWQSISNNAAALLLSPAVAYDTNDLSGIGQDIQSDVLSLGTAYFVTGNTNFAERAWLDLQAAAGWPTWFMPHNDGLGLGEMGLSMGLGYDWFYDYLTPARRSIMTNAMVTLGVKTNLAQYSANRFFVQPAANNWAMVFNSGSVALALALGTEMQATNQSLLNAALNSIRPNFGHFTADNGAYYEGSEYWDYGVAHLIKLLATAQSGLGTTFSLDDAPGFDDTALFEIYNTGPLKDGFDFSDSYQGNICGLGLNWLSRRFNRPEAAYWRRYCATTGGVEDVLWYDGRGTNLTQTGRAPDNYFRGPTSATSPVFDTVELTTARTKWDDSTASFLGSKAGLVGTSAFHNHLDAGSFVFTANGRRWIDDLGTGDYSFPKYFDGTQGWWFYRKRAEGHNTLVLNPQINTNNDQAFNSRSPVIFYRSEPAGDQTVNITDLTPAYAFPTQAPARVWRGTKLFNNRSWLLVQDEIVSSTGQNSWWFAHFASGGTTWGISPDGSSVTLTNGSNRLFVKKISGDGNFMISNAVSFSTTPSPTGGQDNNSAFSKIALNLTGVTNVTIAVLFVPLLPGDNPPQRFPEIVPLASWPTNSLLAATNTAPFAAASNLSVFNNSMATFDLRNFAADAETPSNLLRFAVSQVSTGSISLLPDGHTVQYTPPTNFTGGATFNYLVNDRAADARLLFNYDLQSANWTNRSQPNDISGHWYDGVFDVCNAGIYSNAPLAPAALSPFIVQSARVVNSGTSGARLSRGLTTAEWNLSDADWTFTGWFRRESQTSLDYVFYIGDGNGLSGTGDELEFFCQGNSGDLICQHWNNANVSDFSFKGTNVVAVGAWNQVALTFTRTNLNSGIVQMYFNSKFVGAGAVSSWSLVQNFPIRFGGHYDTTGAQDRWFDGELDDLALFEGALTAAEIASLTNRTVAHFGGRVVTNVLSLSVLSPFLPPQFSAIANTNLLAGRTLSLTNNATDPNSPPQRLLYSLLTAPSGATINATSGVLTWRPAVAIAGTSNLFTVVVTHGGWVTNVSPVVDAYVRDGGFTNLNTGASNSLAVKFFSTVNSGSSRESYLRFPVPTPTGTFTSAKLQLTPLAASFAGTHAVAFVSNDTWGEMTLTWSNKPASGAVLSTWVPALGSPVQADVTAATASELTGDGLLSLRVYGSNQTADGLVTYGSKEGAIASAPLLIITSTNTTSLSATQNFWVVVTSPQKPLLNMPTLSSGGISFTINGDAGPDYIIQGTTNLASPVWQTITVTNPVALPVQWMDTTTASPQFFYRVLLGP